MSRAILNIQEVKDLIKTKFYQMLANPNVKVRPLYIEGHSGIGKTQLVRQAAKELTAELALRLNNQIVQCKTVNLQFTERPEFMGLSYVTENKKTAFAFPLLLPEDGYGIYFLDEANRVDRDIRSGMLTLLEDREINGHKMGKFWLPVLAGNPIDDKYETNEFDVALSDRLAKVVMNGDIQLTIDYFKRQYAGHPLVEFLDHQKEFISFSGSGVSPRSFEYAITATLEFNTIPEKTRQTILSAELGYDCAAVITAFLNDKRAPKYEDLFDGTDSVVAWVTENPERNDAISAINRALVSDLKHKTSQGQAFSDGQKLAIQNYISSIRDEHKCALVIDTTRESLTIQFLQSFIEGTPMVEHFIDMYAMNKN
jgi:hypothetical protein